MNILSRKLQTAWHRYHPRAVQQDIQIFGQRFSSYLLNRQGESAYQWGTWQDFLARKHSEQIFVFGGGASLHDVSPAEWARIDQANTLGWRNFAYQTFVHADYLILRELAAWRGMEGNTYFIEQVTRLMEQIETNPHFAQTLILVQGGWKAVAGNQLIGRRLAPPNYTYLRFKTGARHAQALPSTDFRRGLTHVYGTLTDAVNLAYLGGWSSIVLIGIDLYDSQYFVRSDEKSHERETGQIASQVIHATARSGIVEKMGEWSRWLAERDVHLSVYNPRSLLAEVMPVFRWDEGET